MPVWSKKIGMTCSCCPTSRVLLVGYGQTWMSYNQGREFSSRMVGCSGMGQWLTDSWLSDMRMLEVGWVEPLLIRACWALNPNALLYCWHLLTFVDYSYLGPLGNDPSKSCTPSSMSSLWLRLLSTLCGDSYSPVLKVAEAAATSGNAKYMANHDLTGLILTISNCGFANFGDEVLWFDAIRPFGAWPSEVANCNFPIFRECIWDHLSVLNPFEIKEWHRGWHIEPPFTGHTSPIFPEQLSATSGAPLWSLCRWPKSISIGMG